MSSVVVQKMALGKRQLVLQKLFAPLVGGARPPAFMRPLRSGAVVGLGRDVGGTDFRRLRQPSRIGGVYINYFEIWDELPKEDALFLQKAYMHLDKPSSDRTSDEELLALHCDPLTPNTDAAFIYKRGPHLHVSGNKRDISKAISRCA
jgi:hypothetical protein